MPCTLSDPCASCISARDKQAALEASGGLCCPLGDTPGVRCGYCTAVLGASPHVNVRATDSLAEITAEDRAQWDAMAARVRKQYAEPKATPRKPRSAKQRENDARYGQKMKRESLAAAHQEALWMNADREGDDVFPSALLDEPDALFGEGS